MESVVITLFSLRSSLCILSLLLVEMFVTTYVRACECHAELKVYVLTYLVVNDRSLFILPVYLFK